MKKSALLVLLALSGTAFAQNVEIQRNTLGSGEPGKSGYENAVPLGNGTYHAPQYLPGSPTSATIYPRVVEVPCIETAAGRLSCEGYRWRPEFGRAEYLLIVPTVRKPVPPPVAVVAPIVPEKPRVILREVPPKKIKE